MLKFYRRPSGLLKMKTPWAPGVVQLGMLAPRQFFFPEMIVSRRPLVADQCPMTGAFIALRFRKAPCKQPLLSSTAELLCTFSAREILHYRWFQIGLTSSAISSRS